MKISTINSVSYKKTNKLKISSESRTQKINQEQQNNYNFFYKPAFGNRIYEDFNVEKLPNISLNEEFSSDELIPPKGGVSLMSILDLASYLTEQIRYYEKHGELIHYKRNEVLENCKNQGLNDEETQACLEQAKKDFEAQIKTMKEDANNCINSISPTEKEHTVYRIISRGWSKDSNDYFEKMKSLKIGQDIVLDTIPIYVSSSAKKTICNYGDTKNQILFRINIPKNSHILRFPSFDGIEQCIMKPDAKFRVIDNQEYNNNFHYITLDYLPTEEG